MKVVLRSQDLQGSEEHTATLQTQHLKSLHAERILKYLTKSKLGTVWASNRNDSRGFRAICSLINLICLSSIWSVNF